ncbi:unnamed protein product [Moneuplotes crassus]|uniref:Uncharacterized protein n=1 Tax=Euplotes crassus TaxID=5936 RepID=A0AAD1XZN1_EUPCR|nr:unnamed protein product [Moneuplotes crassus]
MVIGVSSGTTCTDPNASGYTISSSSYTNAAFTGGIDGYLIRLGPISGDFYYLSIGDNGSSNKTVIQRMQQDGTNVWAKSYLRSAGNSIDPYIDTLVIDFQESNCYFADSNQSDITIVEFLCATGVAQRVLSSSGLLSANAFFRMSPVEGSPGFIFGATSIPLLSAVVCVFEGGTSPLNCVQASSGYFPRFAVPLDSNNLFYCLDGGSTEQSFYYIKADLTNPNVNVWGTKVSCPVASCTGFEGIALYDNARKYIYSIYIYNSVAIFSVLNSNDGNQIDSQYTDANTCYDFHEMVWKDDQVYICITCSSQSLSIYNITSGSFTSYESASFSKKIRGMVASEFLFIIGSETSGTNKGYLLKTLLSNPTVNSDIIAGTSFTVTNVDYLLQSITPNFTTIIQINTFTDSGAISDLSITLPFTVESSGTISYYYSTLTYSGLQANQQYVKNIYLTCYASGSGSITHVLDDGSGGSPLTWVTLDSTAQTLTMNTPNVTTTTSYNVYIQSTVGGSTYSRQVVISVDPESSSGSSTSSSSQISANDTKLQPDSFSQSAETTTVTMVGATAGVATISTVALQGGLQGLWSVVHQFQFYLLIPLLSPTVPDKITEFLEGMDFCLFNFDFISFDSFAVFVETEKLMKCNSESGYLYDIGIRYQCLFLSMFQFFMSLLLAMIMHVVIIILYIKFRKYESRLSWPIRYLFKLLTLNFYIRYLVEAYLILDLASSNEVYLSDFSSTGKVLSYCLSLVIVISLMLTIVLAYIISKRVAQDKINLETTYFSEIVDGTKETFWARFAIFFHLLRIFCSVTWIVMSVSFGSVARAIVYCLIQFAFVSIKVTIRYYEEPKDNIVEILDDLMYLGLCIVIVVQANEYNWNESLVNTVITVMTLNTLIILIINIFALVIAILNYLKSKRRMKISQDTTIPSKREDLKINPSNSLNKTKKSKMQRSGTSINIFEEEKHEGMSRNYASDLTPNEINVSE